MSRWFRFYDDAVNDPKVQLLPGELFKAWVNLLCIASKNNGWLPAIDAIAYVLRMSEKKVGEVLDEFVQRSLLDDYDGRLTPHNWNGRQFKSDVSTERVKRLRQRKRNVSPTVPETPPETDTETDKSSEPKGSGASAPLSDPKTDLFNRARQVLGPKSGGGLTAKLLRSLGSEDDPRAIAKARARIEDASTKANPAEWLGRILNGPAVMLAPDGQPFPDGII